MTNGYVKGPGGCRVFYDGRWSGSDEERWYNADDIDELLAKLSGLTCKAEGWEADEDIIVVHGVGIVGSTLSRRNSGAVARWFNGAMAEIMERLMKGGV